MMSEKVNLVVEQDKAGLWYVVSPDIPGLCVVGHSRREALAGVDGRISDLQRAQRFASVTTESAIKCGA
jgi:hypothetical protein